MNNESRWEPERTAGRGLWFWWALASLIGGVIGGGLSLVLSETDAPRNLWRQELIWLGCGALAGLITGLPQWGLLRRRIPEPGWWIVITILGQAIAWAALHPLALALGWRVPPALMATGPSIIWNAALAMTFAIALPGLSVMLLWSLQWLALRPYLPRTRSWLLGGVIAAITSWLWAVVLAVLINDTSLWNSAQLLNENMGWWIAFYLAGALGSGVWGGVIVSSSLRRNGSQFPRKGPPSRPHLATTSQRLNNG
jgi:hypothetical protein